MTNNDIERINSQLNKAKKSLVTFINNPEKSLLECLLYLDSFRSFLEKNNFPYLLEKVICVSKGLFSAKLYFEKIKFSDLDLLEELFFFIKGAFIDLTDHINGISENDPEDFKDKYWQKINFLNDWIIEFLKLPEESSKKEKEQFEKYLIFSIKENFFSIPLNVFKQIILIENKNEIDADGKIFFNNQKIPLVNRTKTLDVSEEKIPKTLVLFDHIGTTLALEIDQINYSKDLNIKNFVPIDLVAGTLYNGPIKYITLLDNNPIFILNPKSSSLNPLTT